jgi:hypothetical protein
MNSLINAVARLCLRSTSNRLKKIVAECSDNKNCIQSPKGFLNKVSKALSTPESHGLNVDDDTYFEIHNAHWRAAYGCHFEPETYPITLKNAN